MFEWAPVSYVYFKAADSRLWELRELLGGLFAHSGEAHTHDGHGRHRGSLWEGVSRSSRSVLMLCGGLFEPAGAEGAFRPSHNPL